MFFQGLGFFFVPALRLYYYFSTAAILFLFFLLICPFCVFVVFCVVFCFCAGFIIGGFVVKPGRYQIPIELKYFLYYEHHFYYCYCLYF